jgi:hypothetical protein
MPSFKATDTIASKPAWLSTAQQTDCHGADPTETGSSGLVMHQGWTVPAGGNANPLAQRETIACVNMISDIGAGDDTAFGLVAGGGGGGGGGATFVEYNSLTEFGGYLPQGAQSTELLGIYYYPPMPAPGHASLPFGTVFVLGGSWSEYQVTTVPSGLFEVWSLGLGFAQAPPTTRLTLELQRPTAQGGPIDFNAAFFQQVWQSIPVVMAAVLIVEDPNDLFGLASLLPTGNADAITGAAWAVSLGGTALGDWPFKLYTTSKW